MSEVATKTKTSVKNTVRNNEVKKYNVIFINDDVTSMDFVVQLLKEKFGYDNERSYDITLIIHEKGQAVVATYHYELAEQKALECTYIARQHGFPLEIKVKPA